MDRSSPIAGTFGASEDGLSCTLTLELSANGLLFGRLQFGDLTFELRGNLSRRPDVAYGFVLDPQSALPLALLRASATPETLTLELDVPEPDTFAAFRNPERLVLARLGLLGGGWARA